MSKSPEFKEVAAGTLNRALSQVDHLSPDVKQNTYNEMMNALLNFEPSYYVQDDFTVALLLTRSGHASRFVGVSKRNVTDPKNPLRGKSLALSRAVRSFVNSRLKRSGGIEA